MLELMFQLRFAALLATLACGSTWADVPSALTLRIEYATDGKPIVLDGRDARVQLLVTSVDVDGRERDVTRQTAVALDVPGVVALTSTGYITPVGNGRAEVTATLGDASTAATIEVRDFHNPRSISFPNQVTPIFTKLGCNGGGCHGKASGQGGFKLSLLGFNPREDYDHLVMESRGRRLFPRLPERSLLIEKAINAVPHGGGQRTARNSEEHRLLVRWVESCMPFGSDRDPVVERIEVVPSLRTLPQEATQQLQVVAIYSDGQMKDITRTTLFEVNNDDLATVDEQGFVELRDRTGDVAVMARYQGHVAVFRATIPLGIEVDSWPEEKNLVDTFVFNKLRHLGMPPSELCPDATFLRRVTLDLAGRLPAVDETKAFVADTNSTKHSELVDRLLSSADHATYFAKKWSAILRNRRPSAGHTFSSFAFHDWLRASFYENRPYDQLVREIVAATGTVESNPPVAWLREVSTTESRLEDVAQLFLGQRIQCAKCHHHPYEKWSQEDYFKLAAFFSKVSTKEGPRPEEPFYFSRRGDATARHPQTGAVLKPAGLDAETAALSVDDDPRQALVNWMVAKDNQFFARSLVNRYWKHFFAVGIVEPEDDMRITNPATNPELLDALANRFVEGGYDQRELLRAICTSTTYRLASEGNEHNVSESNSYSRFYPKRLQAEVLLDAINVVTESQTAFAGVPAGTKAIALPDTGFDSYFLDVFGKPDSATACECERSGEATLAQSLHLLNSAEVQEKLKHDQGRAAKMAAATDDDANLSSLYLSMFSRTPSDEEIVIAKDYLKKKSDNRRAAYEDLIWALINSKEFLFNQ